MRACVLKLIGLGAVIVLVAMTAGNNGQVSWAQQTFFGPITIRTDNLPALTVISGNRDAAGIDLWSTSSGGLNWRILSVGASANLAGRNGNFELWNNWPDPNIGYLRFRLDRAGNLYVSGTKSFVQPHPLEPSKEIVYVSLEGPEAGTYIRGTAQLIHGEAVIQLPEHFGMVTNEEGLTVQLTPRGNCNGLYVEEVSTKQIVVKELMNGKSDVKFDYLVQGIRKGYENHQVIQDKAH